MLPFDAAHLTCELTAAYVNFNAYRANLKSNEAIPMKSEEPVNTIMFVSSRKPDKIVEEELGRRGLNVQWANSIKAATDLLDLASESTGIVTDLALPDG